MHHWQRSSLKIWQIISIHFLDIFFSVGHQLLVCFPNIAFLHDERHQERKLRLVEFLSDEGLEVILLLDKISLISYNLDSITFFSWSFFIASTAHVIYSFHCDQHLLNPASCPVPDTEVSWSFLRNDLKNRLDISTSKILIMLAFLFFPNSFLLDKP